MLDEQLKQLLMQLIEQQQRLTESIDRLAKSNEAMVDIIAQDQEQSDDGVPREL